jgi:acyl-CoA thioesterase FadM
VHVWVERATGRPADVPEPVRRTLAALTAGDRG